jgi:hypothetical protein
MRSGLANLCSKWPLILALLAGLLASTFGAAAPVKSIGYIDSRAGQCKPFFASVAFQANPIPAQARQTCIDQHQGKYQTATSSAGRPAPAT